MWNQLIAIFSVVETRVPEKEIFYVDKLFNIEM